MTVCTAHEVDEEGNCITEDTSICTNGKHVNGNHATEGTECINEKHIDHKVNDTLGITIGVLGYDTVKIPFVGTVKYEIGDWDFVAMQPKEGGCYYEQLGECTHPSLGACNMVTLSDCTYNYLGACDYTFLGTCEYTYLGDCITDVDNGECIKAKLGVCTYEELGACTYEQFGECTHDTWGNCTYDELGVCTYDDLGKCTFDTLGKCEYEQYGKCDLKLLGFCEYDVIGQETKSVSMECKYPETTPQAQYEGEWYDVVLVGADYIITTEDGKQVVLIPQISDNKTTYTYENDVTFVPGGDENTEYVIQYNTRATNVNSDTFKERKEALWKAYEEALAAWEAADKDQKDKQALYDEYQAKFEALEAAFNEFVEAEAAFAEKDLGTLAALPRDIETLVEASGIDTLEDVEKIANAIAIISKDTEDKDYNFMLYMHLFALIFVTYSAVIPQSNRLMISMTVIQPLIVPKALLRIEEKNRRIVVFVIFLMLF